MDNLLIFPSPTKDQAVMEQATRRRGGAIELLCNCCPLPFAEEIMTGHTRGLTVSSRHYGRTHTNPIRFEGVELRVTDRKEFVIVPSAEMIERLLRKAA
jgi:hypothetical protein